jgi:FMN phosphatase YigB (HAD superfamily)
MKELVLFDIDDTLYDCTGFRVSGWRTVLREVGNELNRCGCDFDRGRLFDSLRKVYIRDKNSSCLFGDTLLEAGIDRDVASRCTPIAYETWERFKGEMGVNNGVCEALEELRNRGYTLGVASSGLGDLQRDKLKRLGVEGYFNPDYVFITQEFSDGRFGKCEDFYSGIRDRCSGFDKIWMIGDKFNEDICPSVSSGMNAVMVNSAHYREGDDFKLKRLGVDFIFNFRELLDILK